MLLSSIACIVLSTLCVSPYQGEKVSILRIEKTDTLPDVLNKMSVATKKKIIVDGSVDPQKLGLEGDFTQEALITYLRDTLDYDLMKEDAVVFFKSFAKSTTRPDYSLSELIASLKEIKTILAPMLGGRTGHESAPALFVEALQGLGPEETKLLQNQDMGLPISRLSLETQKKISEAIYFVEYKDCYRQFTANLALIEKLDSLSVTKENTRPVIDFKSSDGTVIPGVRVRSLQVLTTRLPVAANVFSTLKDTVAQDRPEYSFKLSKELEDYNLLAVNKATLSPKEVKMVSELNRWKVRPEAKSDTMVYSVNRARPEASSTPARQLLEALPGSVMRYLMGPITHIDAIPKPKTLYPGSEYEKLRHRTAAQDAIYERTTMLADSELDLVAEWIESKPAGSVIPVKEMPQEIKRALISGLLMRTFRSVGLNLVTRALWPSPYLQNPEKYKLVCIQGDTGASVTLMGVDGGGGFSIARSVDR